VTLTYSTFTTNFPEFSGSQYPQPWFNYWLSVGTKLLRPCAWQDMLDDGMSLFIAHHLALQLRSAKAAATGGDAGGNTGPLANKSVDKVSAGYDTTAGSIEGQGHWNLTMYGTQFIQLARLFGSGGAIASGAGYSVTPALAQWQDGLPRWP
jgi:hypothetical protein